MLPRLSELRLKAAPVRVGAPSPKKGSGEATLNVLMGLGEDEWGHILKQIDDEDACDSIGRICMAGGVFLDDPSKTRTTTPIQRLCGKDATYDQLNKSLGWYKPFENLDGVLAWWRAWCEDEKNATNPLFNVAMLWFKRPMSAREHFAFICGRRNQFLEVKRLYEETLLPADEARYRTKIESLASPRGAPGSHAQAKWMVGIDLAYAFEFLPGSCTTRARATHLDLHAPFGSPLLAIRVWEPAVIGLREGEKVDDLDTVAVEGYTEIAKIAVATPLSGNLKHVRGSIDVRTGARPFEPCKDYDEIAEAAVASDGLNLKYVPGSTLDPARAHERREVHFPDAVPSYTELAKLAASSAHNAHVALAYVPGSIYRLYGTQYRRPIKDYYAIAEVHVRRHPSSLGWVPGSVPIEDVGVVDVERLDDYAALAKIAIEGDPETFRWVPPDLPEYGALEALRDRVVSEKRKREAARQ